MQSNAQTSQRRPGPTASHPMYLNDGLTPKKTALIIVTVIGCIAILWPKVFHPIMFGQAPQKQPMKDTRGPGGGGCCGVVLDSQLFMNATPPEYGPHMYRKGLNLYTGEISLRQERPAHLHPESIYQAMKERGRAIPATTTVPIVERKISPSNPPPRIIDGRPGPIPGMRPPMGAGAVHQPQQKGNSMGFIMPLYTIGIIIFFGYTVTKLLFKRPTPNAPYGPAPVDPNFRKEVFGQENGRHVEDLNGTKLVVTAIQGLIDAADEELNLREKKMTSEENQKKSENSKSSNSGIISSEQTPAAAAAATTTTPLMNGHSEEHNGEESADSKEKDTSQVEEIKKVKCEGEGTKDKVEPIVNNHEEKKKRETSVDRSVTVVGMEITASCEGGKKWTGRPPTPVFMTHSEHSKHDEDFPEPQSIYLEGMLPHESKILVSDAEVKQEEIYDTESNGSGEEPAVILSSKMTLSLINLDAKSEISKQDIESPLADDIEIIGHEEQ